MTVAVAFENTFERELEGLYEPWSATPAPAPRLLVVNEDLARELGIDPAALTPDALTGDGVAMAYSGHQFGGFSPRLGDGRALLLGEIVDVHGRRRDLHLKGSGRTPFARGGDGKAVVGPMLREYVVGEAMHALGIPTTRALAVFATGEQVARDTLLPGAVLARVAASHIRVGTFQYVTLRRDPELLRRLADYTIARHYPGATYLEFYEQVVGAQAALIAQWMLVGFIHGVMNTDNMAISGETIDYGPCAFMDAFDPDTVFSSIDHGGRYAYGNQPHIAQWNLARLAETLLPLLDADQAVAVERATDVLNTFPDAYRDAYARGMRAKLGVEADLGGELIELLGGVDYTTFFRALATSLRRDGDPARALFDDPSAYDAWRERWLAAQPDADAMDRVNPVYIPRNHLVEEALTAATNDDLAPLHRLMEVLTSPYDERAGFERYAEPAPSTFGPFQTFCGT
ncbi:protein adenylyltransferase SelO [Solirubrobacter soli]|uniref:protein adenylyltransferase SelO n=1 Tax=Solirubrobacter soli TaxID=363832 RepID=UPI0004279743|nr:YdiU family protein [Solirubrobacter soli]